MSADRERSVRRARRLLALARSTTFEHEREACERRARTLMEAHGIRPEELAEPVAQRAGGSNHQQPCVQYAAAPGAFLFFGQGMRVTQTTGDGIGTWTVTWVIG